MQSKKLFYLFIAGFILNSILFIMEFNKISESNTGAIEYLKLAPYAIILTGLLLAIYYASKKKQS